MAQESSRDCVPLGSVQSPTSITMSVVAAGPSTHPQAPLSQATGLGDRSETRSLSCHRESGTQGVRRYLDSKTWTRSRGSFGTSVNGRANWSTCAPRSSPASRLWDIASIVSMFPGCKPRGPERAGAPGSWGARIAESDSEPTKGGQRAKAPVDRSLASHTRRCAER